MKRKLEPSEAAKSIGRALKEISLVAVQNPAAISMLTMVGTVAVRPLIPSGVKGGRARAQLDGLFGVARDMTVTLAAMPLIVKGLDILPSVVQATRSPKKK